MIRFLKVTPPMLIGSSIFIATLISREFKMCSSNILVLLKAYLGHTWFKCDEVVSYATELILFLLSSLPCREARQMRTFKQMQQKLAQSAKCSFARPVTNVRFDLSDRRPNRGRTSMELSSQRPVPSSKLANVETDRSEQVIIIATFCSALAGQ